MSFAPSQTVSVSTQDRIMGFVVIVTLAIGIYWIVEFLSEDTKGRFVLNAQMSSSYGISVGAPVRISGVVAGEVSAMKLQENGKVNMTLSMDPAYTNLYRQNSRLKIDSSLGIDSVLSGIGVIFVPGEGQLLSSDDTVKVDEPKSINAIIEELNIESIINKAGNVLVEIEAIAKSVNDNQGAIQQSLDDVSQMTAAFSEASKQLPQALTQIMKTVELLNTTIAAGQAGMNNNMSALEQTLNQSSELMDRLNTIAIEVQPVMQGLPDSQAALQSLLWEVRGLTSQLRQHWLLNSGDQQNAPAAASAPVIYPPDDSLYKSGSQRENNDEGNAKP